LAENILARGDEVSSRGLLLLWGHLWRIQPRDAGYLKGTSR